MRSLATVVLVLPALAGCAGPRAVDMLSPPTLDAWTKVGGDGVYRVETAGAAPEIVGEFHPSATNTFLRTNAEHADFDLEFEFRFDPDRPPLNSGVQIRSRVSPENARVQGLQVELDPSPRAWTAGLYEENRRGWLDDLADNEAARAAYRKGEWNTIRVEARGARVRTWLNGVPAADLTDANCFDRGFIALQVHAVPAMPDLDSVPTIRWRNLRLTPLD